MSTLRITNQTKNSILATHATVADNPVMRRRGLQGLQREDFPQGSGLYIPNCAAIHTVEMAFAFDVLFLDTFTHRVVKTVQSVLPGCHFNTIKVPTEICAALELPEGTIKATWTEPGDVLTMMASGHAGAEELSRVGAL